MSIYTTVEEIVLGKLSQSEKSEFNKPNGSSLISKEKTFGNLFNFNVGPEIRSNLNSLGVYISPLAHRFHSHPVSKLLENHFLYVLSGSFVNQRTIFMSMKESKLKQIEALKGLDNCCLINRIYEVKDFLRYGEKVRSSNRLTYQCNHGQDDFEKIRDFSGVSRNFFIHDELHHWSQEKLLDFLDVVRPNSVLATVVFPVELLDNLDCSANPSFYTFKKINKKKFHFYPDGVASEGYEQSLEGGFLLKTSSIELDDGTIYDVDVIKSIGAHHLIYIHRGDFFKSELRTFGNFECIDPRLLDRRFKIEQFEGIRHDVFKKVIFYCFSLKRIEVESAIAKLRQLDNENLNMRELFYIRDLVLLLKEIKPDEVNGKQGVFEALFFKIIPDFIIKKLNLRKDGAVLYDYLKELKPLEVNLKLERLSRCNIGSFLAGIFNQLEDTFSDLDDELCPGDNKFCIPELNRGFGDYPLENYYSNNLLNSPGLGFLCQEKEKYNSGRRFLGIQLRAPIDRKYNVLPGSLKRYSICWRENNVLHKASSSSSPIPGDLSDSGFLTSSFQEFWGYKDPLKSRERRDLFQHIHLKDSYFNIESAIFSSALPSFLSIGGLNFRNNYQEHLHFLEKHNICFIILQNLEDQLDLYHPLFELMAGSFEVSVVKGSAGIMVFGESEQIGDGFYDIGDKIFQFNPVASINESIKFMGFVPGTVLAFSFSSVYHDNLKLSNDEARNLLQAVKKNNECAFKSLSLSAGVAYGDLLNMVKETLPVLYIKFLNNLQLSPTDLEDVANVLGKSFSIRINNEENFLGKRNESMANGKILAEKCHLSLDQELTNEEVNHLIKNKTKICSNINLYCPSSSSQRYKINNERACLISNQLISGHYSVLKKNFQNESFKGLIKVIEKYPSLYTNIKTIFGFAGSGKSHGVLNMIREQEHKTLIVSPRAKLCLDWNEKLQGTSSKAVTYENFFSCKINQFELFVFDESDLFPPGYIDLCCYQLFRSRNLKDNIIVLGDPLQCKFYTEEDPGNLNSVERFTEQFKGVKYLFESRRSKNWITEVFNVPCVRDNNSKSNGKNAILCPSREVKEMIACMNRARDDETFGFDNGNKPEILTYGESQGLTFENVKVFINHESVLNEKENLICAFTRSVNTVNLIEDDPELDLSANPFLEQLIRNKKYDLKEDVISRGLQIVKSSTYGSSEDDKRYADYNLLAFADLLKYERVEDIEPEVVFVFEALSKTTYPLSPVDFQNVNLLTHLTAKEVRERNFYQGFGKSFKKIRTEQFSDEIKTVSKVLSEPDNFSSIFPRHRNDDHATFKMACRKRLRFDTFYKNKEKLDSKMALGNELANFFLRFLNVERGVNSYLELGHNDFIDCFLNKSTETLVKNGNRSDPDWDYNEVFIFMKNQFCKKSEKAYGSAIAGQTISCFNHRVLHDFSKYCRATEYVIANSIPKGWYIHNRRGFEDLNQFVKSRHKGGLCTYNDYSAFDASQDHGILAFELILLAKLGWPEDKIEDYKNLKLNIKSGLGSLSVMRFTGEFCTFLFNTICNILLCCLKYKDLGNKSVMFAGDDMASLEELEEIDDNRALLGEISVVGKTKVDKRPSFCGWFLTPHGIIKDPTLLMQRSLLSLELKKVHEIVNSYLIEFSYGVRLGDLVSNYLTEEEMFSMSDLFLFFLKHKNHLEGLGKEILNLIIDDNEIYSLEERARRGLSYYFGGFVN